MARPSLYTPELAEHICDLIAKGVPLNRFSEREDVPDDSTVYRWLGAHSEFREMYAHARERMADRFAEEVVTIADEADPETMRGIEHARTRIDARKWAAAKAAPKKYGDLRRTELSGPDGGAIKTEQRVDLSGISDDALAELAAAIGATN